MEVDMVPGASGVSKAQDMAQVDTQEVAGRAACIATAEKNIFLDLRESE